MKQKEKKLDRNQGFIEFNKSCKKTINTYDNDWINDFMTSNDGKTINLDYENLEDWNNNIPKHISNFVKYMKKQGFNSNGVIHLEYTDCGGTIYEKITINNGVVKTKTLHSLDIWELIN